MTDPIYARDLDGTGSMHICSKDDPGAVEYRRTAREAGEVPEYTYAMGTAGDEYVRSVAYNGKHTLPAMFRWAELWAVMNAEL